MQQSPPTERRVPVGIRLARHLTAFAAGVALAAPVGTAGAQTPLAGVSPGPAATPVSLDLVEDVRLLDLLRQAAVTADQAARLAKLADLAAATGERFGNEAVRSADGLKTLALSSRGDLLRNVAPLPDDTRGRFRATAESLAKSRQRQTEEMLTGLTRGVRDILSADQRERVREAMGLGDRRRGTRSPYEDFPDPKRAVEDVRDMIEDLEKIRATAGTGEAQKRFIEIKGKFVRGMDPLSAEYRQASARADALVSEAVSLSPAAFEQRKVTLALEAARREQEGKRRDRGERTDTLPPDTDPYRWFAEQVLLSGRAPALLREFAASPAVPQAAGSP